LKIIQETIPKTFKTYKYLLILLAVSAILLQTGFFIDEESAWWISSSVYFIVPGTLVVFSSLLTIKMAKSGQSIKLILLFTISVSMSFVAEQIWIGYELIGVDPFPSWADFFYLAAYPPLALFLFKLIKIPIRAIPKSNLLFIGLLASSFFIPTYWSTYESIGEESLFDLVLSIIYPIADIIIIVPLIIGILYWVDKRNNFLIYLLLGAFATLLADTFYIYLFQNDLYSVGNSVDILWIWGYMFFAFAIFPSNKFLDYVKKDYIPNISRGINMKIKTRLFIWSIIIIAAIISGGIFLSFSFSELYWSSTVERTELVNADSILIHAQAHLVPEDFLVGDFEKQEKTFSEFFRSIDTTEVLRIKVWSKEGIILFSDSKEIVGKDFSDNLRFQEAIEGSVQPVIKDPVLPENIAEKGYGQLMEVYVPITLEGEIVGVIEIYTSLDLLNNSIDELNQIILIGTLTVTLFVISIIVVSAYNLEKSIVNPIKKLRESTKEISRGNFDVNLEFESSDEINELAADINKMADDLSKNQNELLKAEKLRSIGELASRLGHDLRNPLSTIKTSSAIIRMKAAMAKDDKYTKNLASIDKAVDRMAYQIESVLDFIRTKPLQVTENSLQSIVQEAIDIIKVPENIRINVEPTDVKITCDSQKLGIVFTNLITNSIQAIGENSGEITIRIKENQGEITCEVIDSGPGIPKDEIGKVFEPLFTTKQTGTGLGLASCINVIQQHNGTITLSNNPTTFTIMLPMRQQKSPQFNEMIVQTLKE